MKSKNLVHVGISGIPYARSASINRCKSLYSFLNELGYSILCVNNRAGGFNLEKKIKKKGQEGIINYIYTTPSPYRADTFLGRRYYSIIGRIKEITLILKLSLKKEIDVLFFYPEDDFFELILYRFFSKIFGYPLVAHYVEYRSSFLSKASLKNKLNFFLFDNYFMFFVDGVLPISEFLIENIKRKRKKVHYLKIPPVIDFGLFDKIKNDNDLKRFLYVGSSEYSGAIELILSSFAMVPSMEYYLYLILHGNNIESLKKKIESHPKKDMIKVLSNLEYKDLLKQYKSANAVLIPLSDSLKDTARFPQKMCEYLASKNPVVTTNHGEVKLYFKDRNNALVAVNDDPKNYAEKMNFVIENPNEAAQIGVNGYETGLKYFNVSSYKESLNNFLQQINA